MPVRSAVVRSLRRPARTARQPHDARSFAAYTALRPQPLDGVERVLLRLDWLYWRATRARRPR